LRESRQEKEGRGDLDELLRAKREKAQARKTPKDPS